MRGNMRQKDGLIVCDAPTRGGRGVTGGRGDGRDGDGRGSPVICAKLQTCEDKYDTNMFEGIRKRYNSQIYLDRLRI